MWSGVHLLEHKLLLQIHLHMGMPMLQKLFVFHCTSSSQNPGLAEFSDEFYLLDNCPHDWLFPHCNAVVHHGGAGTTATGLRAGVPTIIIPFFGDQFFWGERVHVVGVGPEPIPVSQITSEKLSAAIMFALDLEVKARAMELAIQIENEDGVAGAVKAFHNHLPAELPTRI